MTYYIERVSERKGDSGMFFIIIIFFKSWIASWHKDRKQNVIIKSCFSAWSGDQYSRRTYLIISEVKGYKTYILVEYMTVLSVEKQLFGIKLQNYIAVMVIKFNFIRVVKVYILGNFEKFPCKLRFWCSEPWFATRKSHY